jgi:hypothetical protein
MRFHALSSPVTEKFTGREKLLVFIMIVKMLMEGRVPDRYGEFLRPENQVAQFIPTVSPLLTPVASCNLLLYQSLPTHIPYRQAKVRRRKDDTGVGTTARRVNSYGSREASPYPDSWRLEARSLSPIYRVVDTLL